MIRFFDVLFSVCAVICLLPLFIFVTFVLRFTGEGEIFFFQERVGFKGNKFKVFKFATMLKNSPNIGKGTITAKNDPRILPFGKILRKSKINELPQLFNVLHGQMSLIGPRPHAKPDLNGIDQDKLNSILELKPGLSGIGSIIFRNEEMILQQFENPRPFYDNVIAPYKTDLELWYKKKRGMALYMKLIFLTILQVFLTDNQYIYRSCADLPKIPEELKNYLL